MGYKRLARWRAYAAALPLLFVGCNASDFPVAGATGRVTLDGEPLTDAKVMFAPAAKAGSIEGGKAAFGRLDADGRFTLSTYARDDGAVVGEHRVTVISLDKDRHGFTRMPVPGGRLEVARGGPNEFAIELTGDMVREFGSQR